MEKTAAATFSHFYFFIVLSLDFTFWCSPRLVKDRYLAAVMSFDEAISYQQVFRNCFSSVIKAAPHKLNHMFWFRSTVHINNTEQTGGFCPRSLLRYPLSSLPNLCLTGRHPPPPPLPPFPHEISRQRKRTEVLVMCMAAPLPSLWLALPSWKTNAHIVGGPQGFH